MPLYTFYCCRPDGGAATLEAHELPSTALAEARAEALLGEHASCSHVVVFEGDVEVATARRPEAEAPKTAPLSIANFDPLALSTALKGLAADRLNISVIATTADGTVTYWNKAATRLYGWSLPEALGRNVIDLNATNSSRDFAEEIMRTLQRGRSWTGEIQLRKRSGAEFSAFVTDMPLGAVEDDDGLIVGASAESGRREAVEAFQPALLAALSQNFRPAFPGSPRR